MTEPAVASSASTGTPIRSLSDFFSWAAHHQSAFTVAIVALTAVLFAYWLTVYLWKLARIRRSIASVLDSWGDLDSQGFFGRLGEIHEYLSKDRYLGHAWNEFKETFLYPDPAAEDRDQVVSNTIDAAQFFNEETILSPTIDLSFTRTVPNVLTGIGILGTFLGLVLGLYGAQDLLDKPEHINALFRGAYLAFLTSLAGLFFSILFSMLITPRLHALSSSLGNLVAYFDSRVQRLTVEKLTRDLLDQARRQTRSLETFATDVAVAIGERITENFTGQLVPVLTQLTEAVFGIHATLETLPKEVVGSLGQRIDQTLDQQVIPLLKELTEAIHKTLDSERDSIVEELTKVVNELRAGIGKATQEQLDGLAKTLHEIQGKLDRVSVALGEKVKEAGDTFRDQMNETSATFRADVEKLLKKLTSSGDSLAKAFSNATAGLHQATIALENKRKLLVEVLSGLQSPLDALNKALPDLRQAIGELDDTSKTLGAFSPVLQELGNTLLEANDRVRALSTNLQEMLRQVQEGARHLHEAWQEQSRRLEALAKRFEGLDEELARTFSRLREGVTNYTQQVAKFHNQLDDNVAKISGVLSASIEELGDICDQIGGRSSR